MFNPKVVWCKTGGNKRAEGFCIPKRRTGGKTRKRNKKEKTTATVATVTLGMSYIMSTAFQQAKDNEEGSKVEDEEGNGTVLVLPVNNHFCKQIMWRIKDTKIWGNGTAVDPTR